MKREFWKRDDQEVIPPILVGVPGSMLGIEVPFLPRPGRLYIVVPYACDGHVDPVSLRGMRWACSIEEAA
jgi:hypothetical protein